MWQIPIEGSFGVEINPGCRDELWHLRVSSNEFLRVYSQVTLANPTASMPCTANGKVLQSLRGATGGDQCGPLSVHHGVPAVHTCHLNKLCYSQCELPNND